MEDRLLLELLETRYEKAHGQFIKGKHTLEDLTIIFLKHQNDHLVHMNADLSNAIAILNKRVDVLETDR